MKRPVAPVPAALFGVDLDAHQERALRALVLFFGADLSRSPAVWEEQARGALAQLAIYGVAPVWLGDKALCEEPTRQRLDATAASRRLGGGHGA